MLESGGGYGMASCSTHPQVWNFILLNLVKCVYEVWNCLSIVWNKYGALGLHYSLASYINGGCYPLLSYGFFKWWFAKFAWPISSLSPPPHDILDSTSNSEYMVSRIEGQVDLGVPSCSQDIGQEMLQAQLHVFFTLEAWYIMIIICPIWEYISIF